MGNARQKKDAGDDAGVSEVQARADEETAQGFSGTKVDPLPNEAYSQETDPTTSPSAVEQRAALAAAEAGADEREAAKAAGVDV